MARSTKQSGKSLFAVARHRTNKVLFAQGFSDTCESEDSFRTFTITETAEQKLEAFLRSNPGSKIAPGAVTAEQAIEWARSNGF